MELLHCAILLAVIIQGKSSVYIEDAPVAQFNNGWNQGNQPKQAWKIDELLKLKIYTALQFNPGVRFKVTWL